MSFSTQWDSLQYDKIDFGYNRVESELSGKPRFIRGNNAYVTLGGKLCKRPGTIEIEGTEISGKRIETMWTYETIETTPRIYIMASMFDLTTGYRQMYYIYLADPTPAWTQFPNLRDINLSVYAHEAVVSRGLFYVKGFPDTSSSEKLGTVVFDGTGGADTLEYWGILPPTVPVAIVGATTLLNEDVDAVETDIDVDSVADFPAAPFTIQVEYEQMEVSAVVGNTLTVTRGVNGTTATTHPEDTIVIWRDWSASDHRVDVYYSWTYTYAYKSSTGQVSNRAPIQTNLDELPSRTGPFQDLCPKITVEGHADTTNIPTIVIFRSTDGGGTYWELEEIANSGAGQIEYIDDSYESGAGGGTFNDPLPDWLLDQDTRAPTLTSNSPPPSVVAPLVIGTDTPSYSNTQIARYASRLWYGVDNILFYSGDEEVTIGIPEECWPSGITGNFFRFPSAVYRVVSTISALYVATLDTIYQITGTNKETFNVVPLFNEIGVPKQNFLSTTPYEDSIVVLTHDYRIARIKDKNVEILSDPLFTDIADAVNAGAAFDIKYWGSLEKEWIIVSGHRDDDSSLSTQWVLDLKKSRMVGEPFWYIPWSIRSSATLSGRIGDGSDQRRLVFAMFDPESGGRAGLSRIDPTARTGGDWFIDERVGFEFDAVTNLFEVPAGNHVNLLRRPGATPDFYGFQIDRLVFAGDTDPETYYFKDDFWSDPIPPLYPEDPARRPLSKQYKTLMYHVHNVVQHVAIEIRKLPSSELFECCNLIFLFDPNSGA